MSQPRPHPHCRLPINFGEEPVCLVPIRVVPPHGRPGRRCRPVVAAKRAVAPPVPVAVGRGEGDFNLNFKIQHSPLPKRGFTLVEVLVVLALLSLIVFALMAVFATTQRAFRASITTTDTLEGGRAVMDLITADLASMTPSYGNSNTYVSGQLYATNANFSVTVKLGFPPQTYPPTPLFQSLIGSPDGVMRTNVLEDIFILGKGNINGVPSWIASGYSVTTNLADGTLYPLYRFYMTTNLTSGNQGAFGLYNSFLSYNYTNAASWSYLMDGVVHLTARVYDTNGVWITNGYANPSFASVPHNVYFDQSIYSEMGCIFFSNAVPASVQVEMGKLDDRTLEHAEALTGAIQSNYLAGTSGQLRIFTRRVWIRNLDPSAYQ